MTKVPQNSLKCKISVKLMGLQKVGMKNLALKNREMGVPVIRIVYNTE